MGAQVSPRTAVSRQGKRGSAPLLASGSLGLTGVPAVPRRGSSYDTLPPMAAQRSLKEQIAALEERRRKLDSQLARLHAEGRAEARKRDTRRKIRLSSRTGDRELFDLPAAKETAR